MLTKEEIIQLYNLEKKLIARNNRRYNLYNQFSVSLSPTAYESVAYSKGVEDAIKLTITLLMTKVKQPETSQEDQRIKQLETMVESLAGIVLDLTSGVTSSDRRSAYNALRNLGYTEQELAQVVHGELIISNDIQLKKDESL